MDKIGLVTVTYNSAHILGPFLDSVFGQTYKNIVLYAVDNNSRDETIKILEASKDKRLVIVKNLQNYGVAKANNQGIKVAIEDGCDQILIINNDVKFEYLLIEKLINIQNQYSCSLVVPKMMCYNSNKIWYAGARFIKSQGFLPVHIGMGELDEGQYDSVVEVEYAPTCCLLVKKQVFYDIGVMDEKYFMYFDDTDFLYRLFKDGRHKIFYCPYTKFYHKVGSISRSFNNKDGKMYRGESFIKYTVRNHIYFLRKKGGIVAYLFIIWLFFRNNIRFIINPKIQKNFATWRLINKSYFEGLVL